MTGYILRVKGIENLDCSLDFYIEREQSIHFDKKDLICIAGDSVEYYALIDADKLGRGHLMCRIEFKDSEVVWDRPVVISGFTGYSIPCMGEGRTISCGKYEISFEKVDDIPKGKYWIYLGVVTDVIDSYEKLTAEQIKSLSKSSVDTSQVDFDVKEGSRLVVAVPSVFRLNVYKDNGIGGKIPFSESIMGANGDVMINIDGVIYEIYGEFFAVRGMLKIYIEQ